jgi:hypothetical protein
MELANLWVKNIVNIFQEKLGSRVVQVEKNHVHSVHVHELPNKNKTSSGTAIQTVS